MGRTATMLGAAAVLAVLQACTLDSDSEPLPQGKSPSPHGTAGTNPDAAASSSGSSGDPSAAAPGTGLGSDASGATGGNGAPAGSVADAGADDSAAPRKDGCQGRPLCDDFEGATAPGQGFGANWSIVTPNCSGSGKISIDTSTAHSGSRSVRVTGSGGYCNHVFLSTKLSESLGRNLFVRFYVRLSEALGGSHVTFLAMRDKSQGRDLRLGGQNQILMWNRETDDATLPELSPAGTAMSRMPAPNRWHCVEFQADGLSGQIRTWFNGELVPGLVADGIPTQDVDGQWARQAQWHPSLEDLRLGWESYGGDARTVWFDDVAVGSQRIGCGQ